MTIAIVIGVCFCVLIICWCIVASIRSSYYEADDLMEYTHWLAEKGALREGFGEDHLVKDYVAQKG